MAEKVIRIFKTYSDEELQKEKMRMESLLNESKSYFKAGDLAMLARMCVESPMSMIRDPDFLMVSMACMYMVFYMLTLQEVEREIFERQFGETP